MNNSIEEKKHSALPTIFRPWTFADVIGQETVVKTLKKQITDKKPPKALLFSGPRGTGKTSLGKIFARAVNCESPVDGSACGECPTCKALNEGQNFTIREIDAASHNGVDDIREINEDVKYVPTVGSYKVYIIDEVHMLSVGAFNALLKTLEEPPAHVIFILATTDPQKVPVTIISRCQKFNLKRLTIEQISKRLVYCSEKENLKVEDDAIETIARLADGGLRDALSLLEQASSFAEANVITNNDVLELVGGADKEDLFNAINVILNNDISGVLNLTSKIYFEGRDIPQFVKDLQVHLRDLMAIKTTTEYKGILDYSNEHIEKLKKQADPLEITNLLQLLEELKQIAVDMKTTISEKSCLEVGLITLCTLEATNSPTSSVPGNIMKELNELKAEIEQLKKNGSVAVAAETASIEECNEPEEVETEQVEPEQVEEPVKEIFASFEEVAEVMSDIEEHGDFNTFMRIIHTNSQLIDNNGVITILYKTEFENLIDCYKDMVIEYLSTKIMDKTIKIETLAN